MQVLRQVGRGGWCQTTPFARPGFGTSLLALLLLVPSIAAAHPFTARDVVGGHDLSAGWQCRVGRSAPGPCTDIPVPAGRGRVRVTMEQTVDLGPGTAPPEALSLGHFATATRVTIGGRAAGRFGPGLVLIEDPPLREGPNRIEIETPVSGYRRRPAWDGKARMGALGTRTTGLLVATSHPGTRRRFVVQLPDELDPTSPPALIVALHPWGVGPWAYVGSELAHRAATSGIVLLMPDGLGNSLWVGPAEQEALAAIDALTAAMPIDPDRIYLFGASMGGAGATTIGYRHPDRFAAVASFFGDSRYETTGYTSGILSTEPMVRAASCFYFAENARNLPTLLVHGRDDTTSLPVQTTLLAERLGALGLPHEAIVRDGRGHEQRLVDEETARMLAFFAVHQRSARPARVSLRSSDAASRRAYWLSVEPRAEGWAFADVEIDRQGAVRVLAADNVRRISIDSTQAPVRPTTTPPLVVVTP